jgi:photosystem II stability/assembly factor-like uncharacterized protein
MKRFKLINTILYISAITINSNAQGWTSIDPTFDPPGNYFLDGTFKNAMQGWMVARGQLPQYLYITQDGGENWIVQVNEDSTFYSNFQFVDDLHGWIKVSKEISPSNPPSYKCFLWQTINGGDSWLEVSSPPDSAFLAITFIDTLNGYSGGNNAIYRTTGGGESWQPTTIQTSLKFGIWDFCFIDKQYGWVVGIRNDLFDAGIILNTVDGGQTWQVQLPATLLLQAVYCTSRMKGYAVGFNISGQGVIMRTTDGGENWETEYMPSSFLNDVAFIDDSTGWVIGDLGFIYNTVDGGEHWVQQVSGTNADLNRLVFTENGETGYIFGDNNTLLKYDNTSFVNDNNGAVPLLFKLYQNYPNPFNPSTTINFNIAKEGIVTIKVYDILGNEMKTLLNESLTSGKYQLTWDGTDNNGNRVSSGTYFINMVSGSFNKSIKTVMVK